MDVQIISTKVIKPSKPTPLHLRTYRLSFIDRWAVFNFPGAIYFFLPEGKHREAENENEKRCDQLEISLSEALTRYYPLAGRYHVDDVLVDCSDQGVEVSRARVNGNLGEIINGRPGAELLDSFTPNEIALAEMVPCPTFSLQINMFNCGGIAIGTRIMHHLCDGLSVVTLLNEWAKINCQGVVKQLDNSPSFELSSLFPARDLGGMNPMPPRLPETNNLVTRNFLFDSAMISALKAEARSPDSGKSPKREPSKVLVVMMCIWRILIRIAEAKHGKLVPTMLTSLISLRQRLQILKHQNYFGSVVGVTTAYSMANENKMELHDLASLFRNAIEKTEEDFAKVRDVDEIYSLLTRSYNEIRADKPVNVDHFIVTSWCGFPCYKIDFGWGKLSWMAGASWPCELIHLMDADCGGNAIEAWVTLNESDMIEFERHYQDQRKPSKSESYSRL